MKKRLIKEEGTNAHGFVDDEMNPGATETQDEYQDQDKLIADIQDGDLVDFGPYGKLYVCDINYHKDIFEGDIKFWVTNRKEDRLEKHPQGLSMYAKYATKILEKGSSAKEENDIDASLDKNKYQLPQIAPTQENWSLEEGAIEDIDSVHNTIHGNLEGSASKFEKIAKDKRAEAELHKQKYQQAVVMAKKIMPGIEKVLRTCSFAIEKIDKVKIYEESDKMVFQKKPEDPITLSNKVVVSGSMQVIGKRNPISPYDYKHYTEYYVSRGQKQSTGASTGTKKANKIIKGIKEKIKQFYPEVDFSAYEGNFEKAQNIKFSISFEFEPKVEAPKERDVYPSDDVDRMNDLQTESWNISEALDLTSDHNGKTESGKIIPTGTTVEYCGHVPGGAIKVKLSDGSEEIMSANCFSELRKGKSENWWQHGSSQEDEPMIGDDETIKTMYRLSGK